MRIHYEIERLINYGVRKKLIEKEDEIYIRNQILEALNIEGYDFSLISIDEDLETPTNILNNILNLAFEMEILESNTSVYRDLLDTKLMGVLTPRPSEVIKKFKNLYENNIKDSTDYFYNLSKYTDYIRTDRIAQNIVWKTITKYGELDITINLSKPEKDPKAIAASRNLPSLNYPKCLLCKENEGFSGRINHPARQNHRIIPINLNNEEWFLQYSPYSYYNEHSIIFNSNHTPMKITKSTFDRLLDFISLFPHYFIGSNADLPIVGGSILTHDHYQGGNYTFPMDKAKDIIKFKLNNYNIDLSILKWPLTVVRLKGDNKEEIANLSYKILSHWQNYSNLDAGIISYTGDIKHNTITPIAKREGEKFIMDLVLRNNRTSNDYPDGIFHPHKELHNIKKENIGLIEVLGLAVLPSRLKEEMILIKDCLINGVEDISTNEEISIHSQWYKYLLTKYKGKINEDNLKEEIGLIFEKVLEDCGVFKQNELGIKQMEDYISSLKATVS